MATNKRKIYPETWVFAGSIVVGALIIALGLRGCKGCPDCNEKAITEPKTKPDTAWVNKSSVVVNGNNNVVNVNQGTGNKIENHSYANHAPAQKSAEQQKKVVKKQEQKKQAQTVVHDTVYVQKECDAANQDNKLIVEYTQGIVDCNGNVTQVEKKGYFTKANNEMRLDSIVTKQTSSSVSAVIDLDTVCNECEKAKRVQWSWQKNRGK